MSFDISFDYRFDSTGFFDDPDRRAALEAAAAIWEARIKDEFDDIPAGTVFTIDDPSASGTGREIVLDGPIDDLLIFVGAQSLGGPLAVGGYDGTDAVGDVHGRRIRDDFRTGATTDFEPWVGTITYDPAVDFSFDIDGPVQGRSDFIGVTLHELAHVFGVGTAPLFKSIGSGGQFDGVNALAVNGGVPIPLQTGLGHVEDRFADDDVLMDPTQTVGTRSLPGDVDFALLADIGYEIDGFVAQGSLPPLVTDGDDITVFGTGLADRIDGLNGADQIQGADGEDTLLGGAGNDTLFGQNDSDMLDGGLGDDQLNGDAGDDILRAGAGQDLLFGGPGTDRFVTFAGAGTVTVQDFDPGREILVLEGSGFASAAAAAAAVTKDFTNVSALTFGDGTRLRVFHDSQSGTPLTAANFELTDAGLTISDDAGTGQLIGGSAADRLSGLSGDDQLDGGAGDDTIDGGAGTDIYFASGPAGVIVDLSAGTAIDGYGDFDTLLSIENVRGTSRGDRLTGDAGSNVLSGRDGDDTLDGGGAADRMDGGAGDDMFFVDDPGDRVIEIAGNGFDRISASAQVNLRNAEIEEIVLTGDGNHRVNGNGADTRIIGNSGSNILVGGGGSDTVTGGAGNDFFAFQITDPEGTTVITDFSEGDKLALDDRFFGFGSGSVDPRDVTAGQIASALSQGTARYDRGNGELWIDPDGSRGDDDPFLLVRIDGSPVIGPGDVLLF